MGVYCSVLGKMVPYSEPLEIGGAVETTEPNHEQQLLLTGEDDTLLRNHESSTEDLETEHALPTPHNFDSSHP